MLICQCTMLFTVKQNRESTKGIRGEKSSKDMASSRNLLATIGAQASPTMGTEPMSFDYIYGTMNHPAFSHFKKSLDHIDTLMRRAAFRH